MCYYSLEGTSRQGKEDDLLVVHQVTHVRKGLVVPDDSNTAVCLTNGLRLELLFIPDITRRRYGLENEEQATFKTRHWLRRDVLFLDRGYKIPFQGLEIGQLIRILELPSPFRPFLSSPDDGVGAMQQPVDAAGANETV
jgi:hypothetical protein